jgi:protein-disulfide isomerase
MTLKSSDRNSIRLASLGRNLSILSLGFAFFAFAVLTSSNFGKSSALADTIAPTAGGAAFTAEQKKALGDIIKDYLIKNPEIMLEVQNAYDEKSQKEQDAKLKDFMAKNAKDIYRSPDSSVAGDPNGDVTVVEFFDYNCGYCKRAMMDMMELMKSDPKLKVVLKEFPVLSAGSVEAAQVGVAVRMQDPSGKKYLDYHQKLLTGRGAADKARAMAAAKEAGADMTKLEKDLASAEVRNTLEENMKLAEAMGMNGTPSYVIGKQVVIGAVGLEALREKISNARCGKTTC